MGKDENRLLAQDFVGELVEREELLQHLLHSDTLQIDRRRDRLRSGVAIVDDVDPAGARQNRQNVAQIRAPRSADSPSR